MTWKDCLQTTAYFDGTKTYSNSNLIHTFKITKRGDTYNLYIDNEAIGEPITNTSYGLYKGIIRGKSSAGFDNFSIDQQVARSCTVTTSSVSQTLTLGMTTPISASVTSGLGNATVIKMRFGSYNTTTGTVSPVEDTDSPYSATFTALAQGYTAVWATAELSDGRTCQSTGETDTNIGVRAFDVFKDGYNFQNLGMENSWELFRDTFGAEQVEYPNGARNPFAEEYYNSIYHPNIGIGGNCLGMSATSLLHYKNPDLLSQFSTEQFIPSYTHDLDDPQTYFSIYYLDYMWNSTSISKYIIKYQGYWLGQEINSQSGEFMTQYNLIKQNIQNGFNNPLVLALYPMNDDPHALIPYKVEENNGIGKIYVYDSNQPCISGVTCTPSDIPYNRYIQVNLTANPITWSYIKDPSDQTTWENPTPYTVPLSLFQQRPTLSTSNLIASNGDANLLITVPGGDTIGYKNKSFINTIHGANKVSVPSNSKKQNSQVYKLPKNNYQILIQGNQYEKNTISLFGTTTLLQLPNLPLTAQSVDTITTDKERRNMTYTTNDSRKNYEAKLYNQINKNTTREFILSGLTNAQGEEDKMVLTDDNKTLSYTNGGQTENIRITIRQVGQNESTLTYDKLISINNEETINITPTNWNNLETSKLLIQTNSQDDKKSNNFKNSTNATLSPTPDTNGQYNTPVTVSLSNQSSNKKNVTTFYKVDNGETQIYDNPFIISTSGGHSLEYWSSDHEGIEEKHHTLSIIINDNIPISVTIDPTIINISTSPTLKSYDSYSNTYPTPTLPLDIKNSEFNLEKNDVIK